MSETDKTIYKILIWLLPLLLTLLGFIGIQIWKSFLELKKLVLSLEKKMIEENFKAKELIKDVEYIKKKLDLI